MRAIVRELVVFDYHQPSDQSVKSKVVEREMGDGALAFLLGCMCGL